MNKTIVKMQKKEKKEQRYNPSFIPNPVFLAKHLDNTLPVLVWNPINPALAELLVFSPHVLHLYGEDAFDFPFEERDEVKSLIKKYGEMNIIIAGSLQSVFEANRGELTASFSRLLGKKGRLIYFEMSAGITNYLNNIFNELGEVNSFLHQSILSKVPELVGLKKEEVNKAFSMTRFEKIKDGHLAVPLRLGIGKQVDIQPYFLLLKQKHN